ncbi:ATP-binding cassette domain-containing protein, partial [Escherichia coli]|uniref:ATP-binding cassette domain-containing protein n=1 Tax=Escherichia coli TaxID=562 RepID=UPI001C6FF478
MSSVLICEGTFRLGDTKTLQLPRLTLTAGDSWAFVGSNGSGKSALARALSGELPLLKGERPSQFSHITRLASEHLQKRVSDEWHRNTTQMRGPGEDDTGRPPAALIRSE